MRLFLALIIAACTTLGAAEASELRAQSARSLADGNWAEAYAGYRELLVAAEVDASAVGDDLQAAWTCLQRLGRQQEIDELLAVSLPRHAQHWRYHLAAGEILYSAPHHGSIVDGAYRRGHYDGGRRVVSAERDRVRALQHLVTARDLAAAQDAAADERIGILLTTADVLTAFRADWEWQLLTDLAVLPDYHEGHWWHHDSQRGAPMTEDGAPVLYAVPAEWAAAASDGERWRWCLDQAQALGGRGKAEALQRRIDFARRNFGVETLQQISWWGRVLHADAGDEALAAYRVHTLADDECLARVATGVERFVLPADHHPIALVRELIALDGAWRSWAHEQLAQIFENRRQYPRAVEHWRAANRSERVAQIVDNWGRIEPQRTQPAGERATFAFTWRNAESAEFRAQRLDLDALIAAVDAELDDPDGSPDWQRLDVQRLAHRIIHEGHAALLGPVVAEWQVALDPAPDHWDRQTVIETPLTEGGAYLITATTPGGVPHHAVLWLADLALLCKPVDGGQLVIVADAASGDPVAEASIWGLGFSQQRRGGDWRLDRDEFSLRTAADGSVVVPNERSGRQQRWLLVARGPDGGLAFDGFNGLWVHDHGGGRHDQTSAYLISDRPVYRPGDTVHLAAWLRRAAYHLDDDREAALGNRGVVLEIMDPEGERVVQERITTDPYGGLAFSFAVPEGATLGTWRVAIPGHPGSLGFRVEEYRKPEFEVSVSAPEEPVALGDTIEATIAADYLFGAPVSEGEVHYTVTRTSVDERWFPPTPWDWLYGRGWWWIAPEASWYPGWQEWGCRAPEPWWHPGHREPPEVVMEITEPLPADGRVTVRIDTAAAAAVFGDRDHRYHITAEVRDPSRRTIVGEGTVVAAHRPLSVRVWPQRGFLRVGDPLPVAVAVARADGSPAAVDGSLLLERIGYDDERRVQTTAVAEVDLATAADGRAEHRFEVEAAGQYRLRYRAVVGDEQVDGAVIVSVLGAADEGLPDARFEALQVIPDREAYAPGDTARVLVATERADATVWWFVRCENGRYPLPQTLDLAGHTRVLEIPLTRADMPNVFVEAVTVADGRVHTVARQLVLPPADRSLTVSVETPPESVLPGAEVELTLQVRDDQGRPVTGPNVVTVYDRAIEYISGGSNVGPIVEYFWSWKRHHHPQTRHTLDRIGDRAWPEHRPHMLDLGVFGHLLSFDLAYSSDDEDGDRRSENVREDMQPGNQRGVLFGSAEADGAVAMAATAPSGGEPAAESNTGANTPAAEPTLRSDFADSAFWDGRVITDAEGRATITMTMPDDLTTWRIRAWSVGAGTRVGETSTELVTAKNVMVRLQTPRYAVERDRLVLSANVHNEFDEAVELAVALALDGDVCVRAEGVAAEQRISVPAHGQVRVDWPLRVVATGEAVVRVEALGERESDAVERRFPVVLHGSERVETWSRVLRPEEAATRIAFAVPEERVPEHSELVVRASPSVAAALVEALPYLVSYPGESTDQTVARFVPTVLVHGILTEMGVDLAAARAAQGPIDPGELPDGGYEDWRAWDHNPVFDPDEVADMARHGVARLAELQVGDGGWGWYGARHQHSEAHTTALVVRGLHQARAAGVAVPEGLLAQGLAWLAAHQRERVAWLAKDDDRQAGALDALVYTVLAEQGRGDAGSGQAMGARLYRDRNDLPVYAKAMLALAEHWLGAADRSAMYRRNTEQFLQRNADNQTAWLDTGASPWWYWYGSEVEANAWYLKLLVALAPESAETAAVAKYLLANRRHASYWDSTRDTALAIEALAEFWRASGEVEAEATVSVWLDGEEVGGFIFTPATLFTAERSLRIASAALDSGEHELEIRREGSGPLYVNAWLTTLPTGDEIAAAGLDLRVERRVYRLVRDDRAVHEAGARGQAVAGTAQAWRREPLAAGEVIASGELLEVELIVTAANDYEYLVIRDPRPAGCEPEDLRSGWGDFGLHAYREIRDRATTFALRRLPRGEHGIRYRLRAEIPGDFAQLPSIARGVYAPELRGNSALRRLAIGEADAAE